MADLRELDVRHLAALQAVVATGSFARAGQKLGYTQSAISQQIAALEQLVGAPLFDRPGGPRPARLTRLGEFVSERARELLVRLDAISEEIDRVRDGRAGVLGIGAFQSVSAVVLPAVLTRLRVQFPDLSYRIVNADNDRALVEALESGEADLAFVAADAAGIVTEPVLADPWVLLAPPGRFRPGAVAVDDLHGEPLVAQNLDTWQQQCEAEFRSLGVEPSIMFRTNDNTTISAMVRAGIGLAVLPLLATDGHAEGLTIHPLSPVLRDRQILLGRRSDRTLPPSAVRFVAELHDVCAELAERLSDDGQSPASSMIRRA